MPPHIVAWLVRARYSTGETLSLHRTVEEATLARQRHERRGATAELRSAGGELLLTDHCSFCGTGIGAVGGLHVSPLGAVVAICDACVGRYHALAEAPAESEVLPRTS